MKPRDFFFATVILGMLALARGFHWLDVAVVLSMWWCGMGLALVVRDAMGGGAA